MDMVCQTVLVPEGLGEGGDELAVGDYVGRDGVVRAAAGGRLQAVHYQGGKVLGRGTIRKKIEREEPKIR